MTPPSKYWPTPIARPSSPASIATPSSSLHSVPRADTPPPTTRRESVGPRSSGNSSTGSESNSEWVPSLSVLNTVASVVPLLADFELHAISLRKALLGPLAERTELTCRINKELYTYGRSNLVFEVEFSDEVYWILRLHLNPEDERETLASRSDYWKTFVESEVAAMRIVKERTTIPVPDVFDYGGCDSFFGRPFILMRAMPGSIVDHIGLVVPEFPEGDKDLFEENPGKERLVEKIFAQLADFHVQLSKITFSSMGCLTFKTEEDGTTTYKVVEDCEELPAFSNSYSYLENHKFKDMLKSTEVTEDSTTQLEERFITSLFRAALLSLADIRDAFGPFPLRHGDLNLVNFLVDEEANITGVIDWEMAEAVIVEEFGYYSRFTHDEDPEGTDHSVVRVTNQSLFIKALKALEEVHPTPPFASGRRLSDLHTSFSCALASYWTPSRETLSILLGKTSKEIDENIERWIEEWVKLPVGNALLQKILT